MLRRFLYLDPTALSQYISAVEGGLTSSATTRTRSQGTAGGGVSARIVNAAGERTNEHEHSLTTSDTDQARFDRLISALRGEPERFAWLDVVNPDLDFSDIGVGAMISWECEVYVPTVVQVLAASGEALPAMRAAAKLLPLARAMGFNTEGMPSETQLDATTSFVEQLEADLVVVGEDEATEWTVAGQIRRDGLATREIDGRAMVVGKGQPQPVARPVEAVPNTAGDVAASAGAATTDGTGAAT